MIRSPGYGLPGAKGERGLKGEAGSQGAQGSQGVKGETGSVGPKGDTGQSGAAGATGPAGANGAQGIQGVAGPAGPAGSPGFVALPNITLTDGGLIAIAGIRRKVYACQGALVGDRIAVFPTEGTPVGYVIGDAWCVTANQVTVNFSGPALVVLTNNVIPLKVVAFR